MAHLSAACTLISSVVSDYIPLIPFRYTVNVLLHVFSVSHWLTPIETIIPICETFPVPTYAQSQPVALEN
jgi:hypothetical protein